MTMSGETDRSARVRSELVRLVGQYGAAVLDDVRRVRAMLSDAVPGATAEANVIGLALGVGVPTRLRESSSPTAIEDVSRELERSSSVQPADARWAVGAIAEALGLQAPAHQPPPTPTAPPIGERTAVPGGAGGSSADEVTVSWAGGRASATPGRTLLIGRDPSADVVLDSSASSRRHGEIAWSASGWTYSDLGSTQGSFVDGNRVTTTPLAGSTTLVLGQGSEAVTLQVQAPSGASAVPPPPPAPPAPAPLRPAVTEARPGGALAAAAAAPTEVGRSAGDVVTVSLAGQTRTAAPGGAVTIGRETDNDLVASATTVSRHHARVEQRKGVWTLVDLGSTSGTWLEGRRVGEVKLSGRQTFLVGDPSSGDTLTTECAQRAGGATAVQSAKQARTGTRKNLVPIIVAAAVALVVLVGGAIWALNRGDDTPTKPVAATITKDDLAKATVYIDAGRFTGSGVVIDAKRGLIMTNAHVAAPRALGLALTSHTFAPDLPENPDLVDIWTTTGKDKAADPRFKGEVIASDGYLDVAIIQIRKRYSGALLEDGDLAQLTQATLGNSDDVQSSDFVRFIGYPAVSDSIAPTFTEGTIAGPVQDERLNSTHAEINTTAKIFHGNSGGLAADKTGHMIGITTWSRQQNDGGDSLSSFRPVDLVKSVISRATKIADSGSGTYRSPYVVKAPSNAKETDLFYAEPKQAGTAVSGCRSTSVGGSFRAIAVMYKNFPRGQKNTDVYATLSRNGQVVATAQSVFPAKFPPKGCITLTFDQELPTGASYDFEVGVGGDLRPIVNSSYKFN